MNEAQVIREIARRWPAIGDDCAVLPGKDGGHQLFASDMLIQGVHFTRKDPAEKIGWKAIAVNVSDVAAMGGIPTAAVISVGLPRSTTIAFVRRLYRGINRCAERFGLEVVGGDTVRSAQCVVNVGILGIVKRGHLVRRSGARSGDQLLVTGRLGGAVRSGGHLSFTPRLKEAQMLVRQVKLHAMMDLSDGLLLDLPRLCRASGVDAAVEVDRIPCRKGVAWHRAVAEGEDFELLMALPKREADRLLGWAPGRLRCGLHRIGQVTGKGKGTVRYLDETGRLRSPLQKGFSHF